MDKLEDHPITGQTMHVQLITEMDLSLMRYGNVPAIESKQREEVDRLCLTDIPYLLPQGLAGSIPFLENEAVTFFGGAGPLYTSTWSFQMDGSVASDPDVFEPNGGGWGSNPIVGFCIYFGLVDPLVNEVVTFREIGVQLTVAAESQDATCRRQV